MNFNCPHARHMSNYSCLSFLRANSQLSDVYLIRLKSQMQSRAIQYKLSEHFFDRAAAARKTNKSCKRSNILRHLKVCLLEDKQNFKTIYTYIYSLRVHLRNVPAIVRVFFSNALYLYIAQFAKMIKSYICLKHLDI